MLRMLLLVGLFVGTGEVAFSQDGKPAVEDARLGELARRYRQILERNPRPGTAFDQWYGLHRDAGKLDQLVLTVEQRAHAAPEQYAPRVLLGMVYEQCGKSDEALAEYVEAGRLAPEQYVPAMLQGQLLTRKRRHKEAVSALSGALERNPPRSDVIAIATQLGRLHLRMGEGAEAVRAWSQIAERFPEDPHVLEELAELLTDEAQFAEAIRRWQQVALLAREDDLRLEARIAVADLRARQGQTQAAAGQFDEILEQVRPDSWIARDVHRRIARLFASSDDYAGWIDFYRGRLRRRPEDLDAMIELARALAQAGRPQESIDQLRAAVQRAPDRRDIRETLIRALARRGEFSDAIEQAQHLAERYPRDVQALRQLGLLHLQAAERAGAARQAAERQAAAAWARIAAIRENDPQLALQAAELCRQSAGLLAARETEAPTVKPPTAKRSSPLRQAAEKHYREAVRRAPDELRHREHLGEFLHACGRGEEAVQVWSQIAAESHDTAENWFRLAEVYSHFGYAEEALAAGKQAVARRPDEFPFRDRLVELLLATEAYDAALQQVDAAAQLAEEPQQQQRVRQRRVQVLAAANRIDQEIDRLQQVVAAGDGPLDDQWLLGLLQAERGRYSEAAEAFRDAAERSPDNAPLVRDFARALELSGDFRNAAEQLRRLVRLNPQQNMDDYERLVLLELRLQDFQAARKTVAQLLSISPANPNHHRLRATVALRAGELDEGLDALRHAVRLAPRDSSFRLELADQLSQCGLHHEALEHYWQCLEMTNRLEDRLPLVAAMTDLAERAGVFDGFLEKLRRLQRKDENVRSTTLCVVEALRRSGDHAEARRELVTLVDVQTDDLNALRQLAQLAEAEEDWTAAAKWWQRVATLTSDARDLQKLLSCLRNSGNSQRAEEVWRQLVTRAGSSENAGEQIAACDMIDDCLRRGDFDAAAQYAGWALAQAPDRWDYRYRHAYSHLCLGKYDQAIESFESVLRLPPPSTLPGQTSSLPAGPRLSREHQELAAAKAAERRMQQFKRFQKVQRLRGRRGVRANSVRNSILLPADQSTAEIYAIIGSYFASSQRATQNWIELRRQQANTDRRHWREILLAIAADGSLAQRHALVEEIIQMLPHDPLPHVARLAHERGAHDVARLSAQDKQKEIEGLRESFRWLGQNRPELQREMLLTYGHHLVTFGKRPEAVSPFVEALTHPVAETRAAAANALRNLDLTGTGVMAERTEADGVVPALVGALEDPSPEVVQAAAQALGRCGALAENAVQPLLSVLEHSDESTRNHAARALAQIGPVSIGPLTDALGDPAPRVRIGAAFALQEIGSSAAPAVPALTGLLKDQHAAVRCRAMRALGAIGPPAKAALDELVEILSTAESEECRIAVYALSDIGMEARPAAPALVGLLNHEDPLLGSLAGRVLRRIDPETALKHLGEAYDPVQAVLAGNANLKVGPYDWPQWGGWSGRNNTPHTSRLPVDWDIQTGKNIKWSAKLGSQTYGNPAVANGKVFIGSNNGAGYVSRFPSSVDLGVLLCFDEQTGQFLWQLSRPKLATGRVHDWPMQGMPSTPLVDGDRLWVVTNRGEVMCLDTEGFRDGDNDGPYKREDNNHPDEADIVWTFDMMKELGVSQHNMANCSMTCAGDILFVCTSNGVDESHLNIPAPQAAAFIAMDRWSGQVLWSDNSPGANILHGQWCSPTYAVLGGTPQVIFGGGDGWLYSFDPRGDGKGKSKLLWKFDCNPKTSKWVLGGRGTRNNLIGFPCVYDELVYIAVGQDPEHGEGEGHLWCIDPNGRGDISSELAVDRQGNPLPHRRIQVVDPSQGEKVIANPNSAMVWHYDKLDLDGDSQIDFEEQLHRSIGTPAIKDDLLYLADFSGLFHCIDAKTGRPHWTYDLFAASWGSALVADGKVYIGDEDGDISVFRHGEQRELLEEVYMDNSVYSTPIVANSVLFISNRSRLYAIQQE